MQATAADGRRFGVARPPSAIRRRLSLKERLGGFKGFGCCGATWGLSSQTIVLTDTDTDNNHDHAILTYDHQPIQPLPPPPPQLDDDGIDTVNLIPALQGPQSAAAAAETVSSDGCLLLQPPPPPAATPASSSMSLAAALEAERQLRDPYDDDDDDDNNNGRVTSSGSTANNNSVVGGGLDNDINGRTGSSGQGTPARVSLMRLLEETSEMEEKQQEEKEEEEEDVKNDDRMCCVCMGRKKGAALIPCGHTFCRMCSRELWLSRGTCPLCNRCILEILDIF